VLLLSTVILSDRYLHIFSSIILPLATVLLV